MNIKDLVMQLEDFTIKSPGDKVVFVALEDTYIASYCPHKYMTVVDPPSKDLYIFDAIRIENGEVRMYYGPKLLFWNTDMMLDHIKEVKFHTFRPHNKDGGFYEH